MTDATISGGPVDDFTGGWAIFPFFGEKAHHWTHDDTAKQEGGKVYNSSCGISVGARTKTPALHRGGFLKCKLCERRAA